jgi:hypothetical protein
MYLYIYMQLRVETYDKNKIVLNYALLLTIHADATVHALYAFIKKISKAKRVSSLYIY